jgi:hypothetical protein
VTTGPEAESVKGNRRGAGYCQGRLQVDDPDQVALADDALESKKGAATIPSSSAQVVKLEEDTNPEISSTVIAALGHLRAASSGIGAHHHNSKALTERYSRFGVTRAEGLGCL